MSIAADIYRDFVARLGDAKLTAEEAALAQRVAERLAYVATVWPLASPDLQERLAIVRDLDLATLENLAVAKTLQVGNAMRQAVLSSVSGAIRIGLGILTA